MMTTAQRASGMTGMAVVLIASLRSVAGYPPLWIRPWSWALITFASASLVWFAATWVRERRARSSQHA